jgi:hypothetical protein
MTKTKTPAFRFDEKIVVLFADGKEFMVDLSSIVSKFVGYINQPFRIYVGKRLCCETADWKQEPSEIPPEEVRYKIPEPTNDVVENKNIDFERIVRDDHRSDP